MPILKLSLRTWRTSPGHQAGACLLSASLLLSGSVLLHLERSVSSAAERVERETRFTVFLADSAAAPEKLSDEIRLKLGAHAETDIKSKLVSKNEVVDHLRKNHPDLYAEIRDLGAEGDQLVPRAVHLVTEVEPNEREAVVASLQKIPGIESVQTSEGHSKVLRSPVHGLRWLLRALVVGVLAAWVVGWVSLARSQAAGLDGIQANLKLWGASELGSRLPGVLAGVWVGLPAAIMACASYWAFARPILMKLSTESVLFASSGVTGLSICLCLGFMSLAAGAMVGWVSAGSR